MKLVKFTKPLTIAEIVDRYNIPKEDWYKGCGLYQFDVGSRGEVEGTTFHGNVNEYSLKETVDFLDGVTDQDEIDYLEEFAGLDDFVVDTIGIVEVNSSEEEGQDWFLVE